MFTNFITPEQAADFDAQNGRSRKESLAYYRRLQRSKARCTVCGQPAWRYGGTGLCFTCTTGESDPSDDYELTEP